MAPPLAAGFLFTRAGRRIAAVIAGLVAAVLLGIVMMLGSIAAMAATPGWSWGGSCSFDPAGVGSVTVTNARDGEEVTLESGQLQNAATILQIAQELGLPPTAGKIALMTGLQESKLKMLANTSVPESLSFPHQGTGSDHDSLNVFQQRAFWGSVPDRMDLDFAARAFFGGPSGPNQGSPAGLLDIEGWESMGLGEAAQAVQVSDFPDYYDGWAEAAEQVILAVSGATECGGTGPAGDDGDGRDGWGGFENGRIPVEFLAPIPWSPEHRLREDAAAALGEMNAAWTARFGYPMPINDAYRDYEGQERAREDWCRRGDCGKAATPGTSNHGWALAIDVAVGFSDTEYLWLKQNASLYGWVHPAWAEPDGSNPESWHWEFAGRTAAA